MNYTAQCVPRRHLRNIEFKFTYTRYGRPSFSTAYTFVLVGSGTDLISLLIFFFLLLLFLLGRTLQKSLWFGSFVFNQIGMKFGRNVLQEITHRLTVGFFDFTSHFQDGGLMYVGHKYHPSTFDIFGDLFPARTLATPRKCFCGWATGRDSNKV